MIDMYTSFFSIECVHDGHVGGPKQYNDFPLGNIFYFYANIFYCFSPSTWPPCTHSIDHNKKIYIYYLTVFSDFLNVIFRETGHRIRSPAKKKQNRE